MTLSELVKSNLEYAMEQRDGYFWEGTDSVKEDKRTAALYILAYLEEHPADPGSIESLYSGMVADIKKPQNKSFLTEIDLSFDWTRQADLEYLILAIFKQVLPESQKASVNRIVPPHAAAEELFLQQVHQLWISIAESGLISDWRGEKKRKRYHGVELELSLEDDGAATFEIRYRDESTTYVTCEVIVLPDNLRCFERGNFCALGGEGYNVLYYNLRHLTRALAVVLELIEEAENGTFRFDEPED